MNTEKHLFDTADFFEIVLAHLIRDKLVFARAKELRMTGDDMLTTSKFGEALYKAFADIAFSINDSPISYELFGTHLKQKFYSRELSDAQIDDASKLWAGLYSIQLNTLYVANKLQDFLKFRQQSKARAEILDNDELAGTFAQISGKFDKLEMGAKATWINPFELIHKREITTTICTGFPHLDSHICGVGKGEYAILLGYSGCGKTALATSMAHNIAINKGNKVDYFSLEEPAVNLANRFYSREFRISYTDLHRGLAYMELDQAFPNMDKKRMANIPNLRIHDLRELAPLSTDKLKAILDKQYTDTGRVPDVVFIDQMDFLEPCVLRDKIQKWEKYEQLTYDCDHFSNYKIGGEHPFALWVLHQATGPNRKTFTSQEMAAFKGLHRPADTVLGIGRESMENQDFNLFALKARHGDTCWSLGFSGDLKYMTFTEVAGSLGGALQTVYNDPAPDDDLPKIELITDPNVRPATPQNPS